MRVSAMISVALLGTASNLAFQATHASVAGEGRAGNSTIV
jgi:hypothetical protein